MDWFVSDAPPAVVSRRSDLATAFQPEQMDRALERLTRDVAFLEEHQLLVPCERFRLDPPQTYEQAENAARAVRDHLGLDAEPLYELQSVVERLGLLAFALSLGPDGGDAAYSEVGDAGVAVINIDMDAGRRRFNAAHELGHHIFGDAYSPEYAINPVNEAERFINSFAAHLLMPRSGVANIWADQSSERIRAMEIAAHFRVSWSAACSHLRNLDVVPANVFEQLLEDPPRKGEMIELGLSYGIELAAPRVPPLFAKAVVRAYKAGKLTITRVLGFMCGTIGEEDLPERDAVPLKSVRKEFEAIS